MELRGIDPLTFRMQSGRSTTELQPPTLIAKTIILKHKYADFVFNLILDSYLIAKYILH